MGSHPPYLHAIHRRARRARQYARRVALGLVATFALGACATAYVASRPGATVTVENRAFERAKVEVFDGLRLIKRFRVEGNTSASASIRAPGQPVTFCVTFLARNAEWCSEMPITVAQDDEVVLVLDQWRMQEPYRR